MNHLGEYDVIVIGAGHAGIEAAHAAATLGAKTAVFTMSLDAIGNMPCNPSIGGTAKGTLVRELDALGGVMGLAADATYLQSRMLNKGKGPAVHALRVQTDRKRYHEYMKHALELTPGLAIHQAEVVGLEVENGRVKGIVTQLNGEYTAKCVVLATGTNLGGKIFVGDAWYASGPDGMHAANALTESLKDTIARVIPYFEQEIRPRIEAGERVVIAAHGNSLRALVKYFENLSEEEIVGVNIPTAVPLVYEFAPDFTVVHKEYLGDPAVIAAKMKSVANQGKAGK